MSRSNQIGRQPGSAAAAEDEHDTDNNEADELLCRQNQGDANVQTHHSRDNGITQVEERNYSNTGEDRDYVTIRIPFWMCLVAPVLAILVGIIVMFIVLIAMGPPVKVDEEMHNVEEMHGQDAVHIFKGYDLNHDDHISIFEFGQLVPHIRDIASLADRVKPAEKFPEYTPKKGEEVLVIHANFSQLHQKPILTMKDFMSLDFTGQRTLYGLETWTEPNRRHAVFGASEFKSLLPYDIHNPIVGMPYRILSYDATFDKSGCAVSPHKKDSSRKYVPPVPQEKEKLLFRLLAMMHPRPFVNMRFHPRGTVACVQAFSDKYVHVVFRMHAEFQLSEAPANPFWFSPAQFLGDLVISRDGSHVHYFHMEVPNERKLNVDMEWLMEASEGSDGMEVDIGYMPLMEWTMGADSHLPLPDQSIRPDLALPQPPSKITFTEEMCRDEALRLLEVEFYQFKEVRYHNLTEAVRLSEEQNKPLHAIILWGALDDQSC